MPSIPLFTSVPPRLSRLDTKGREIGEDYQRECIASWQRAGFEPVSVNSTNETHSHSLPVISLARDASSIIGRPHVFFADLLAAASMEARGRPFVLLNADLILTTTVDFSARVAQLRPGEFMFSRRLDIDQLHQTEGTPWHSGYDFFAGHADDISGLPDFGMVFGAPWWDHFFPLLMYFRGCRISQREPVVFHLNHAERWNWATWEALGQRFVAEIKPRATNKTYRQQLENAIDRRTGRLLSDLKYNLWKRLPKNAVGETHRMLHRVSNANLSFLDKISLATP
jgi:hypothetical protein